MISLLCGDDRSIRGQHEVDARVRDQIGLEPAQWSNKTQIFLYEFTNHLLVRSGSCIQIKALRDVDVQCAIKASRCGHSKKCRSTKKHGNILVTFEIDDL